MKKSFISICAILILIILNSCQKNVSDNPSNPPDSTQQPTMSDLLKDSVYLFTKEVYLWHEVIPSYDEFDPRQYTGSTDLEAAQNEMAAIRNLQPEDRAHSYSFVTTKAESDGLQTGSDEDFGFFIKAAALDQALPYDSVHWFVEYVYDRSSAGTNGVERGWYISKINGNNIGYDDASVDILNDVFFGNTTSATFEFTKQDNSTVSVNLSKTSFTANSVLYSDVFTGGAHKVGYVVFNQFFGAPSRTELGNVFNDFAAAGITDLVVDLRYNHGGSTETQDTLADLIAPSSANSNVMYQYIFNDSLQAGNFPLLKLKGFRGSTIFKPENNTITYDKAGSLNLNRVFFIVTGETASASELLINNLRPYMDVKLIGDTTYGKPVGFFPIDIFDYSIYPISFKTVNSAGSAEYYAGFAPDKLAPDGVNRNWGDVQEPCLASALNYIATGSFGRAAFTSDAENRRKLAVQKQFQPLHQKLYTKKFTGMFVEKNL